MIGRYKVFYILVLLSLLNGCLLTDSFKQELIDENKKSEIQVKIDELEKAYTLQELSEKIKHFEEMAPKINRVVELENDLAYLTKLMKSDRLKQSQTHQIANNSGLPRLQNIIKDSQQNTVPSEQPSVQIGKANPILAQRPSNSEIDFAAIQKSEMTENPRGKYMDIDKKFSQAKVNQNTNTKALLRPDYPNTKELVGELTATSQLRKSDTKNLKHMEYAQNEQCKSIKNEGGSLSLHLASYSDEKSAMNGWQKLLKKHRGVLCDLSPRLADVSVKGKSYLSLRAGPLNNRKTALELCAEIRANGDYCASADYFGKTF